MFRLRQVVALLTLSVVALGSFATNANAAVIFDSFTSPANQQVTDFPGGGTASNSQGGLTGILFTNTRAVDITATSGNPVQSATLQVLGGSGRVSIANAESIGSVSHLTYNFGGALNFNGVGSIIVNDAIQDGALGGAPTIQLSFTNAANVTTSTLVLGVPTVSGDLVFSLAGLNAAVLGGVTQFQVTINTPGDARPGGAGTDMSFGPIEFPGNPPFLVTNEVPEPASLATLGVMGLLAGAFGRRKLKAKAVA